MNLASLASSADGGALVLAFGRHRCRMARVDLLPHGDPRLALPPIEDVYQAPPAREVLPPSRDSYVRHARLHQMIRTISSLHFPTGSRPEHGFEGDATSGRAWSSNGAGDSHAVAWSASAVAALAFDHEAPRERAADLARRAPYEPSALAMSLAMGRQRACNSLEWVVVGADGDRCGGEGHADELSGYTSSTDAALALWAGLHAISEAHANLALQLTDATASGRHRLTEAEERVLLEPPPDGEGPPARDAVTAAVKLFAALGVDWTASVRRRA
ncbi:MAG: hypothetical protein U0414_25015 [Polyangiaceae bacterium]